MKSIVHIRFPAQCGKQTYKYRSYYDNPQVGDIVTVLPTSVHPQGTQNVTVVQVTRLASGSPESSAADRLRVAKLHTRVSPDTDTGARLYQYASIDLSRAGQTPYRTALASIFTDEAGFVPTTQQEKYLMDTCSKGLIENPTPDHAELIEKHEAAIAAIKAREKADRKAEKAERKAERERKQRIKERAERRELALQVLSDIAGDTQYPAVDRITAAAELHGRA